MYESPEDTEEWPLEESELCSVVRTGEEGWQTSQRASRDSRPEPASNSSFMSPG